MEMNYKPNSYKYKEEQAQAATTERKKNVQKVISGPVQVRKKSEFSKIRDIFLPEDMDKVKEYIILDVIVPSVKNALSDIFNSFLFGQKGGRGNGSPVSKISYGNFFSKPVSSGNSGVSTPSTRTTYSYDEFTFPYRADAEMVLDQLCELINVYGVVSVADFYDCLGKSGTHTDCNYGWTDLSSAKTIKVREGYAISLPKAMPINR